LLAEQHRYRPLVAYGLRARRRLAFDLLSPTLETFRALICVLEYRYGNSFTDGAPVLGTVWAATSEQTRRVRMAAKNMLCKDNESQALYYVFNHVFFFLLHNDRYSGSYRRDEVGITNASSY
jgi:hypothetical protein